MKAIEIFYLLIFFNIIMAIFGGMGLTSGLQGNSEGFNSATDQNKVNYSGLLNFFTVAMGSICFLLAAAYIATMIPGVGTEKSPMGIVYGFGIAFQAVYISSWFTFWNPLVQLVPTLGFFGVMLTFGVESIFVIGMIQMSTGGFEGMK